MAGVSLPSSVHDEGRCTYTVTPEMEQEEFVQAMTVLTGLVSQLKEVVVQTVSGVQQVEVPFQQRYAGLRAYQRWSRVQ